ncbi:MAG: hypothetical protein ACI85I_002542 [Arenicella sp.]|jgi:hypothetical protein
MNNRILKSILVAFTLVLFCEIAAAQSSVYIYKNPRTGEGDYMFMYGMPTIDDAEFMAKEKLVELGYAEELVRKQASSKNKGHGLIVKSILTNKYGKDFTVYGAALGCKSKEEAEKKALENMKKFNPEWNEISHSVVHKFVDE